MKGIMRFFPTADISSVYQINFKRLYGIGIRGLIFDIDNTLVEHDAPADEGTVRLFETIRGAGIGTCLLSNNQEKRVKPFAEAVGSEYVFKAGKPSPKGCREAMEIMHTDEESTLLIGDQLFTDVWCAYNAGIRSVLVSRIAFHERFWIHLKRIPEALLLLLYRILPRRRDRKLEEALYEN